MQLVIFIPNEIQDVCCSCLHIYFLTFNNTHKLFGFTVSYLQRKFIILQKVLIHPIKLSRGA